MNARTARVIQVIEVVTYEGEGTPVSLGREVIRYYDLDGVLLAAVDPARTTSEQAYDSVRGVYVPWSPKPDGSP